MAGLPENRPPVRAVSLEDLTALVTRDRGPDTIQGLAIVDPNEPPTCAAHLAALTIARRNPGTAVYSAETSSSVIYAMPDGTVLLCVGIDLLIVLPIVDR